MSAINCPLCQKSFKSTSSLKIHENIHSRRELFQCKECNRSFTQAGNLKIHLKTHTEERPFECLQCKKKFSREQVLKSHLKIHTKRTRDNKCPMCPKAFFDKVNRCLARYSPRATTTNGPTNRALNKPALPGPN